MTIKVKLLLALAAGLVVSVTATVVCRKVEPPAGKSTVSVANALPWNTMAFVTFGAGSKVLPTAWPFATPISSLACQFPVAGKGSQALPLDGGYLNGTISFVAMPGCGNTKAELDVNNPKWYDTADVSLVDGYSNNVQIEFMEATVTTLGPPNGPRGNEKVFGLFPYGCDVCVARQNPPCGIPTGRDGCKGGTQYNPDVPCQFQGTVMGGGARIVVALVGTRN